MHMKQNKTWIHRIQLFSETAKAAAVYPPAWIMKIDARKGEREPKHAFETAEQNGLRVRN